MTRLLYFTRTQERRRDEIFIVVKEKIWMECHLMRVDKGAKRIMDLDLILDFGEIWCIKCRDWWEWGASKIWFSIATITACKVKFKKSYLPQF